MSQTLTEPMTWADLTAVVPELDLYLEAARAAGEAGADHWADLLPKWRYVDFLRLFDPEGPFGSCSTLAWRVAVRHLRQAFYEVKR